MLFYKIIVLTLSNSITSRRDKSILYSRITITILVISALIAYCKLSFVFLVKILVNSGELYNIVSIIYLIKLFTLAILLLPFISKELSLFLLTSFPIGKYNILAFFMNNILFHYFGCYFNYYLNRVLYRLMLYKLLYLFINFVLSIITYCQYLKNKILIQDNLVYLLVFGLLSNVNPNYYELLISWYYFTLARSYVGSNKEILSNYPVIRKWLINVLTINIILLEILLLNIIFTIIFSKLDLIFDYILRMFGTFNGNAEGGDSYSPGPSSNPGGPNGNNPNEPFFGSLKAKNNHHNSRGDKKGPEKNRDNNTSRDEEQSEQEDVFALFTDHDTYDRSKDQIKHFSKKEYLSYYYKKNKEKYKIYKEKNADRIKKYAKTTYDKNREHILTQKRAVYAENKQRTIEKNVQEQTQNLELLGADPITALAIANNKPKLGKVAVRLTNIETNETSIYLSQRDASNHLKVKPNVLGKALTADKIIKGKFKVSRLSEIDGEVTPELFHKMTQNYQHGIPVSITNVLTGDIKEFRSCQEASRDKNINLNVNTIRNHMDKDTLAKKIYKIQKM